MSRLLSLGAFATAATLAFAPLRSALAQSAAPRFDAWNIAYAIPTGWRVTQQQGRVHTLTSPGNDQVVYVVPGLYQSFEEVAAELPKAFQLLGLVGVPSGASQSSTVNGFRAMTADYMGQDRSGMPVQARVVAVLAAQGSGLFALGLARPAAASQLGSVLTEMMQGVAIPGAPTVNAQAVAALRGKWTLYSGRADGGSSVLGSSSRSYEETVEFDGAGRFAFSSSASVSVTAPGSAGSTSGANGSSDAGSYTVIGTTLVVRGRQGMAAYEVQLLGDRIVADGRTYLRM